MEKEKCPNCGSTLVVLEWSPFGYDLVCPNEECPVVKEMNQKFMRSFNLNKDKK